MYLDLLWAYSSAGEHFVDIEGVTGSIPVTPTISLKRFLKQSVRFGALSNKILFYVFLNFNEISATKPETIAAITIIKGLCQSSGLVIKNAKNSPTNTNKKL